MNLLHDPWMPVRSADGQRHWITPCRLAEPQWRAFDADRPDFNGALAQFAIGLLQTTTPVADSIEWRGLFNAPPDVETLQRWFEPVAVAFELDGDGPRFMQDFGLGTDGVAVNEISGLLIDAPGENTVKNNADHFVKRAQLNGLCPACAAMALFTLQVNAPSGGAGHRTGLRGGGPLTTLVLAPAGGHLWNDLWMNVRDRPAFLAQGGDADQRAPQRSFPWLGPHSALQAPTPKGELAQSQVHPAHLYWAMPRRIRLQTSTTPSGTCDCCRRTAKPLIGHYCAKTYGLNYQGEWAHPLSPYYHETKKGWLPVHPQPDGLGYRHWLAWVLGAAGESSATRVAAVVGRALTLSHRHTGGQLRLLAFGYDMDKMKARCWYESTIPLYGLEGCSADARHGIEAEVGRWLNAAELGSDYLVAAVRDAWFPDDPKKKAETAKKLAYIRAAFWSATQERFYRQLRALIEAVLENLDQPALGVRLAWRDALTRAAVHLFDGCFVGAGQIERQNPRRAARAHRRLNDNLHGYELQRALGLPTNPSATNPVRKSSKRASKETA